MNKVEDKCRERGLLAAVGWDGRRSLAKAGDVVEESPSLVICEASVADDVVIFVDAARPEELTANISAVGSIVYDAFRVFGAVPNLGPGKTDALPVWVGKGSKTSRIKTLCEEGASVVFSLP